METEVKVHNIQTTGRFAIPDSYQAHTTHFLSAEWSSVLDTYRHLDAKDSRHRAERMSDCRQIAWFCRNSLTGLVRVLANHCKQRWCPLCGAAKKTLIAHEISRWLPTTRYPKMMTLTLKHTYEPLTDQINHLYSSFRKLRKTKLLTKNVPGGVWFFQITYNDKTETWHPHLHCLMSGNYVSLGKLSRLWLKITGDSKIVNIKLVDDFTSASHEVARYCARPSPIKDLLKAQRIEIFTAMEGRRLCGTWGTARVLSLSRPESNEPGEWIRLARWSTLRDNLNINTDAQTILQAWKEGTPLPPDVTLIEYDDFIDKSFYLTKPEPPPPLLWDDPL